MIDFQGVSKSYGEQAVLRDVDFRINTGCRAGIVGPNGAGKTTIFSLIAGELTPDSGDIAIPSDSRLGYVRQQLRPDQVAMSLLEYAESGQPELPRIHREIEALEADLSGLEGERRKQALKAMGSLQTEFEALGGYTIRTRASAALGGLGFAERDFDRPFCDFSGGWQMRAELARVLAPEPDLLLLDEPSNYLDIPAVEWLQRFLRDFKGTLALISHDRYLLNSLTSVTLELAGAEITTYPGNYDYYVVERQRSSERFVAARKAQAGKREQAQRFIDRYRADKKRASLVQSKIKMLERMEDITLPTDAVSPGRIRLPAPVRAGQEVMRLEDVGVTYDDRHWVLRHVDLSVQRGDKIALIGLNGMGKTTLLRAMAGSLTPREGKRVTGHKVAVGYQSQEFAETMNPSVSVFDTVRSITAKLSDQEVRTLLGGMGFPGDAIDKKVEILSGGEKVRLAFARLLADPPNFLLLDEPTTHLDIHARETLERALSDFAGTICLVSHDVEFVRNVADLTIAMTPPGITPYCGDYDYYKEKSAELTGGRPAAHTAPQSADRRQGRRERAERVQEFSRRRRSLKRNLNKTERRIEQLESQRDRLLAEMEAPQPGTDTTGTTPHGAEWYARRHRGLAEAQQKLDDMTRQWEAFAIEMDELEQEFRSE